MAMNNIAKIKKLMLKLKFIEIRKE
jgi:hypothetical protein